MAIPVEKHVTLPPKRATGNCFRRKHRATIRAQVTLAALTLVLLAACDRDTESMLRSRLDQWFFLGKTVYFDSRTRCTGAMFYVAVDRARPSLAVQTNPEGAKDAFRFGDVAAIRMEGVSPAQLTDVLLLSGAGIFGKQALAAGALAVSCFERTEFGGFLFEALNRPGATLAYDKQNAGLIVLDPDRYKLFYVAGDVW